MKLKELINERWEDSAEGYGKSVRRELQEEMEIWKQYIFDHIDIKKDARILDIGCGPGFLTILFSKYGYEATGVDGASNMIHQARKNAVENDCYPDFEIMDCHHLDFQNDTFDLVISRNVVWTLYDPAAAYKEWKRVLKPGGSIVVFDASWNREYHDERTMNRKIELRKQLKTEPVKPEYFCNPDLGKELDQKSVLGFYDRPQWDLAVFRELGMNTDLDEDAWQTLWSEETKIKSGATPMFMIKAQKQTN